ncbi:MAG: TonB-dependent receptor [Gammaproteobacteria bacterium]|nr:TonB-dependent receptor [Gammaproteobacteria bacterium]
MTRFPRSSLALSLALLCPELAVADVQPPAEVERIEVTGSRIRRTQVEGVAPITVIDAQAIERSGLSSVGELMQTLNANNGASFDGNEASGFSSASSSVNLRAMGTNRTLVLIDGRRQASFPTAAGGSTNFVDVGNIPTAAVERIEILTGGGAAIYGSDAIGGVVNILLKKDFEGAELALRRDRPEGGHRERNKLSWVQGWHTDTSQTVLILEANDQEPLLSKDNGFTDDRGPYGDDAPSTTAAYVYDRNRRFHASRENGPSAEQCTSLFGDKGIVDPASKYRCLYDNLSDQGLASEDESYNLVLNSRYDLNADWQLYGMLQGASENSDKYKEKKGFSATIYRDSQTGALSYSAAGLTRPDEFSIRRRMEEYPTPRLYETEDDKQSLLVGAQGRLGDYELDTSWSSAWSQMRRDSKDMVDADGLLEILTLDPRDTRPGRWYPLNPLTPEQVDKVFGVSKKNSESAMHQFQSVLRGDLMELPAGPLSFAATVEAAREDYDDGLDEKTVAGRFIGQGGTSGAGARDRYALAGELSLPLLTGEQSLELSLAGRYDYYEDETDVDGAFSPQLGLLYHPIPEVLLRMSAGGSFRAPDMHRIHAGMTRGYTSRNLPLPNGTIYQDNYTSITAGNPALEEEKGHYANLGAVVELAEDWDLSLDLWRIELEGAVRTQRASVIYNDPARDYTGRFGQCEDLPGNGFISTVDNDGLINLLCVRNGPINIAEESAQGVDFSTNYRWPDTTWGAFSTKLEASYLQRKEVRESEDDPVVEYTETEYLPHWKATASLSWEYQDLSASLSYYLTGKAQGEDLFLLTENGKPVKRATTDVLDSYQRLNLSFSYELPWDGKLKWGVTNLTGEMPPLLDIRNERHADWPYFEQDAGYGVIGRSYYLGYSQRF